MTTNGVYDVLTVAHVRLLKKAKTEGDVLVVLLNSDDSVKRYKGEKRPINQQEHRAEVIANLDSVDYVLVFPQDTPLEYLGEIKPNVHVKGGTYIKERVEKEENLLKDFGGRVQLFELEEGLSTTITIETILDKYLNNPSRD